jgi:hypothetical protein
VFPPADRSPRRTASSRSALDGSSSAPANDGTHIEGARRETTTASTTPRTRRRWRWQCCGPCKTEHVSFGTPCDKRRVRYPVSLARGRVVKDRGSSWLSSIPREELRRSPSTIGGGEGNWRYRTRRSTTFRECRLTVECEVPHIQRSTGTQCQERSRVHGYLLYPSAVTPDAAPSSPCCRTAPTSCEPTTVKPCPFGSSVVSTAGGASTHGGASCRPTTVAPSVASGVRGHLAFVLPKHTTIHRNKRRRFTEEVINLHAGARASGWRVPAGGRFCLFAGSPTRRAFHLAGSRPCCCCCCCCRRCRCCCTTRSSRRHCRRACI